MRDTDTYLRRHQDSRPGDDGVPGRCLARQDFLGSWTYPIAARSTHEANTPAWRRSYLSRSPSVLGGAAGAHDDPSDGMSRRQAVSWGQAAAGPVLEAGESTASGSPCDVEESDCWSRQLPVSPVKVGQGGTGRGPVFVGDVLPGHELDDGGQGLRPVRLTAHWCTIFLSEVTRPPMHPRCHRVIALLA